MIEVKINDFLDFVSERSRRHFDEFQPEVSQFIVKTEEKYIDEINVFLLSYKHNPSLEKILNPVHNKIREYLTWLRWLNWNIANLGPVLFKDMDGAAERLALATMAYASGRFIDDGFDGHENFKGHQSTLVGFLRNYASNRPIHEACAQSVFVGFQIFHHTLRRLEHRSLAQIATELSKLFDIAASGLLAECHTGTDIEPDLYLQIIRRKAVAYNMMLYKPFLHETEPDLRNNLFLLLGEMDEFAQIINDLSDIEEDNRSGKLNIFTHLQDAPLFIYEEIETRLQRLMDLMMRLPSDVQNAVSAMLVNIKFEEFLKKLKPLLAPASSSKPMSERKKNVYALEIQIQEAIRKALKHLTRAQAAHGAFPTYWSESLNMVHGNIISSPFITGMILFALSDVKGKQVPVIWDKGIEFLKSCRKANGFFSFFEEGIDDDLDDTCLLNFLIQQREKDCDEYYAQLAYRISKLPRLRGLYFTWIRSSAEQQNDIDPCVNLNVVRFLTFNGTDCTPTLKALKSLSQKNAVVEGTLYYESSWAFLYYFSSLPDNVKRYLISDVRLEQLLSRPVEQNPIDQAFQLYCISTAGINPSDAKRLAILLLESQLPTGGWPNFAVFRAFNYWGSPELTTALCIQALQKYMVFTSK